MNKIKVERSLKLRNEDFKGRGKYDLVTGVDQGDSKWIDSFGKQALNTGVLTAKSQRLSEDAIKSHWAKTLSIAPKTALTSPFVWEKTRIIIQGATQIPVNKHSQNIQHWNEKVFRK